MRISNYLRDHRRSEPIASDGRTGVFGSLAAWAGIDRAVVYALLEPLQKLFLGPVTSLLIAVCFTSELQGYYFTFYSLLGLQVFAELGLGQVLIQFASHEWAKLRLDDRGAIIGDAEALSRLSSLGRIAMGWYAVAGVALAIVLSFAGHMFFLHSPRADLAWATPWLVVSMLAGLNLTLLPLFALLEGCNQVSQVYGFKLTATLAMTIAIWLSIALGAGLWTPAIAVVVRITYSAMFVVRHRRFFAGILTRFPSRAVHWRLEVWPMQWRIALSWVCGYLSSSLFTPVAFHYNGAAVGGQTGMTLNVVGALSIASANWMYAKVPRFGVLIARGEYQELDRLALRSALASLSISAFLAFLLWCAVLALNVLRHPLADRILSPTPVALFAAAGVLMQIPFNQAIYLRAHRREPFVLVSVLHGGLTCLSTLTLGALYGPVGAAAGSLGVVALVVIPAGTVTWMRCRTAWHRRASDTPPDRVEIRVAEQG
jgi:hypothetical protein